MYWIYVAIFAVIVFVPGMIDRGIPPYLSETQTEEYAILLLGTLGFVLFFSREKALKLMRKSRSKIQSELNKTRKDLVHSYSYIGEINRKLDILEKVVLQIPEGDQTTETDENGYYMPILEAVRVITQSKVVMLCFVGGSGEVLKQVKNTEKMPDEFKSCSCSGSTRAVHKLEKCIIIRSPYSINNVTTRLVIAKGSGSNKATEDLEIFNALLSHALLIFMYFRKNCAATDIS